MVNPVVSFAKPAMRLYHQLGNVQLFLLQQTSSKEVGDKSRRINWTNKNNMANQCCFDFGDELAACANTSRHHWPRLNGGSDCFGAIALNDESPSFSYERHCQYCQGERARQHYVECGKRFHHGRFITKIARFAAKVVACSLTREKIMHPMLNTAVKAARQAASFINRASRDLATSSPAPKKIITTL